MSGDTLDLAGENYWNEIWSHGSVANLVDPRQDEIGNYANHAIHRFIRSVFASQTTRGKTLLEVGCARSAWLPYFASEFGFFVAGLDYSSIGCRQAEQVLAGAGIRGVIYQADVFKPPPELLHALDVVISFGLVEHFADTTVCLKALGDLLAPSGILITIIPNLAGALGVIQRRLDRQVFDLHIPLTREELENKHEAAGLVVVKSRLIMASNWGVLNVGTWPRRTPRFAVERLISWVTRLSWLAERAAPRLLKPNRFTSPYIAIAARLQATDIALGVNQAANDGVRAAAKQRNESNS